MGVSVEGEICQYKEQRIPRVEASRFLDVSQGPLLLRKAVAVVLTCVLLYCSYAVLASRILLLPFAGTSAVPDGHQSGDCSSPSPSVPQYFQTSPELWAGPTATGRAPFLAQTNPVFFVPTATFVPNNPLETAEPIIGQAQNKSIFRLMGNLSPYFSNPSGFGVNEYPLPPGANISQVQVRVEHTAQW
jgi:hypothetical protein